MKILWQDQVFDVRECEVVPGQISEGDWLQYNLMLVRVKTIQKDCPRLENLNALFTMFTCESEDGTIVPIRDPRGKQSVLKKNKVKVVTA